MYFSTAGNTQMFPIPVEKVREMIDSVNKGEKLELHINNDGEIDPEFKSAVGEDSLTRFDKSKRKRKKKKSSAPTAPPVAADAGRQQGNGKSNGNNNRNNKRKR
jgi:TusA-related sulfurtransferase